MAPGSWPGHIRACHSMTVFACACGAQLGESLEEQLGQRLLRMPPPPQLPPRVRQGQQHTIEQQQQPSMFQLPYELPPVMTDPMQVRTCRSGIAQCCAYSCGCRFRGSCSTSSASSACMESCNACHARCAWHSAAVVKAARQRCGL